MKAPRVYMCEDSLEGILSAVYGAYMSRYGHEYQSVAAGDYVERELFTEYISVVTDVDKAMRVADAVVHKISGLAWHWIKYAAMSCHMDKADSIYKFLVLGFREGPKIIEQLANPIVNRMMWLEREVSRETQRLYGFVRFKELSQGIMFSKLAPKHHQLPLLAEHFADRFPMENWMIYDENRHEVCVHEVGKGWFMTSSVTADDSVIRQVSESEKQFEEWWKSFYETIGIKERENPRCRMNMMPKMYWKNMPEMMGR
ncbi:MAG: DNA metabolism protein [Clostridia bacterium]|nr:DNA metabolism protein [Clostridia bacterium]NCD04086.1 DNA metabolism protein [Clostridia bacterium]